MYLLLIVNNLGSVRGSMPQTCGCTIVNHQYFGLNVCESVAMDIRKVRTTKLAIETIEHEDTDFIVVSVSMIIGSVFGFEVT